MTIIFIQYILDFEIKTNEIMKYNTKNNKKLTFSFPRRYSCPKIQWTPQKSVSEVECIYNSKCVLKNNQLMIISELRII